jgi:hypothetical protein
MHRSGTSAVTGSLHHAGFSAGNDDQLLPPQNDNKKGFFENVELVEINELILQANNLRWDLVPPFTAMIPSLIVPRECQTRMKNLLADPNIVLFKDPRLSITFSAWRALIEECLVVVPFRRVQSVIESLGKRNQFADFKTLLLSRAYFRHLVSAVDGLPVFGVSYENLVNDPRGSFREITQWISRHGITAPHESIQDVEKFIDLNLNLSIIKDSSIDNSIVTETDMMWQSFSGPHEQFCSSGLSETFWDKDVQKIELEKFIFSQISEKELQEEMYRIEFGELHTELDEVQTTVNQLKTEKQRLENERESQLSHIQLLASELERQAGELKRRENKLQLVQKRVSQLEGQLSDIRTSETWKIGHAILTPVRLLRRGWK